MLVFALLIFICAFSCYFCSPSFSLLDRCSFKMGVMPRSFLIFVCDRSCGHSALSFSLWRGMQPDLSWILAGMYNCFRTVLKLLQTVLAPYLEGSMSSLKCVRPSVSSFCSLATAKHVFCWRRRWVPLWAQDSLIKVSFWSLSDCHDHYVVIQNLQYGCCFLCFNSYQS